MVSILTIMNEPLPLPPQDVRRIRRALGITQAQFAKRVGVDPITVARWETGQRRCAGLYAESVRAQDPERPAVPRPSRAHATPEDPRFSALAQLVRAFFDGSAAKAATALLARENLSSQDLAELSRLIESKKKARSTRKA